MQSIHGLNQAFKTMDKNHKFIIPASGTIIRWADDYSDKYATSEEESAAFDGFIAGAEAVLKFITENKININLLNPEKP